VPRRTSKEGLRLIAIGLSPTCTPLGNLTTPGTRLRTIGTTSSHGDSKRSTSSVFETHIDPCDLRAYACYNLAWAVVRDCIVRDVGLWKRPKVREYYDRVLTKTNWWYRGGHQRRGYALDASFVAMSFVILKAAPGESVWGSRPMSDQDTVRVWKQRD
jgi:hypothetical protein